VTKFVSEFELELLIIYYINQIISYLFYLLLFYLQLFIYYFFILQLAVFGRKNNMP
jgi:hypothetical protein